MSNISSSNRVDEVVPQDLDQTPHNIEGLEHGQLNGLSIEEADALTVRNQLESPLLRLPGEIRDAIYTYALGGHRFCLEHTNSSTLGDWTIVASNQHDRPVRELFGLSQTCRQTYAECGLKLFSLNEFGSRATYMHILRRAEKRFTVEQQNAIKVVWIRLCHFDCYLRDDELGYPLDEFQGLRRVIVQGMCAGSDHPSHSHIGRSVRLAAGKEVQVTLEHLKKGTAQSDTG